MTEYWNREQPLDLRVKSSTKRENKPYDRDNVQRNCILASLLKRPSSSNSNIEFLSHPKSNERFLMSNASNACKNISSSNFIVPQQPDAIQSSFPRHHTSSGYIHQGIVNGNRHTMEFKTNRIKHEADSDEITIVFDSYRVLANGLRKNCNNQPTSESTISGYVPNYRKFYARCHSNQLFHSKLSNQQNINRQTLNQSEFAFSNFPERSNELGHLNSIQNQSRLFNTHLQNQNVPSIKIEQDIEKCRSEDSPETCKQEKDKILKCLLTNTVNDNIYLCNNYILQNSMYDKKLQFSKSDVFLRFRYPQLNMKQQQSCHIYYPEAVKAVQKDSILKSLLVTNRPKPDTAQRSSGSYNAGSPGSESTSSGSTDSGVFSDILPDERRRISRGPSNRYIKTGTGASVETLKILRQIIMERQQKTDREL